ncbi:MAG: cytochrome c biogenesis protein CcsA, partial [Candidatus Methylomirabilota bacterium]
MARLTLAKLLGSAALLMLAAGLFWGLKVVPPDAFQGEVQRIMYLHVPSVSTAYLAVLVTFCTSILYLWKRDPRFDAVAVSSAEIAVVFFGIT